MTQIAEYYAKAGVLVDKRSISDVRKMLTGIERQFQRFGKNVFEGRRSPLNFGMNNPKGFGGIRKRIEGLFAKPFNVSVTLNPSSYSLIRRQVMAAVGDIRTTVRVTPVVGPSRGGNQTRTVVTNQVSRTPSRGGTSSGSAFGRRAAESLASGVGMGGGFAAFARLGVPALGVAGAAFGMRSVANSAAANQAVQMQMLLASQGNRTLAAQQMQYLFGLGRTYGADVLDVAPGYAQMLAGVRGSKMESTLQRDFQSLYQYMSISGATKDEQSRTIRALSQMISKGTVQREELVGQLAEARMPEAYGIFADVMAGGDRAKFDKMVQNRQVRAVDAIPLFLEELRRRSNPLVGEMANQVGFRQRQLGVTRQEWMRTFNDAGGTQASVGLYRSLEQSLRSSIPMARILGDAFYRASNAVQTVVLGFGEISDWVQGNAGKGNFMTKLFGNPEDSKFLETLKTMLQDISNVFMGMNDAGDDFKTTLSVIAELLSGIMEAISAVAQYAGAISKYGTTAGLAYAYNSRDNRERADKEARDMLGPGRSRAEYRNAADQIYDFYQTRNNPPPPVWDGKPTELRAGVMGYFSRANDIAASGNYGGRLNPLNWMAGYAGAFQNESVPTNSPMTSQNVTVNVNGNIKVDHQGRVETYPDEEFNRNLINSVFSNYASTLITTSSVTGAF